MDDIKLTADSKKEHRKKERKEMLRLKALPKALRKLDAYLYQYVDFMDVYDGYIGDFTGQTIPEKPVKNPFIVINKMKLNFPHKNSLSDEQKTLYVIKIEEAFNRMGFYFKANLFENTKHLEIYELLCYHIENPPDIGFDVLTSVNYNGVTLGIERAEVELY